MAMTHRTTFALDEATIGRLRHLALVWEVSLAEVVRRSVEMAERQAAQGSLDLEARLDAWYRKGGLEPAVARSWLQEVAEGRSEWDRGQ
ncbi:MAG: hypothetical protein WCQ50_22595 [Spirochaetota bacterium]